MVTRMEKNPINNWRSMLTNVEFVVLPYASTTGRSLLDILVEQLRSGRWNHFRAAIAFVKESGLFDNLLEAMQAFLADGGSIDLTSGADEFKGNTRGSDLGAIKRLLKTFEGATNGKLYLYHEAGRTFHPKLYLFSNEEKKEALLILGSSNLSEGGLIDNIEACAIIGFDLSKDDHRASFQELAGYFATYWTEN